MRYIMRKVIKIIALFAFVLFINQFFSVFQDFQKHSNAQLDDGSPQSGLPAALSRREAGEGHAVGNKDAGPKQDIVIMRIERNLQEERTFKPSDEQKLQDRTVKLKKQSGATNDKPSHSSQNANSQNLVPNIAQPVRVHVPSTASSANFNLRPTELGDIYISVKTTKKYHNERVGLLLDTWVPMARDVTHFFTDAEDSELSQKMGGHLVNTNCSAVHTRKALCCKMSVEFDYFIAANKRWFCHVDDDTYVNIPALMAQLKSYNYTHDWYLGKPSLNHPLEVIEPNKPSQKLAFWFATGGAGFCISRGLALKMVPFSGGGRLMKVCDKIRLPDDCTIGFIISHYLKTELTVVKEFHSHLEGLWLIKSKNLEKQVTFSYVKTNKGTWNIVDAQGFSKDEDPTRLRSIHCLLYPYTKGCPVKPKR